MYSIHKAVFVLSVLFSMSTFSQAYACLGVSRSISVNSFSANKGVGPGAGLGLRDGEVVLTFDDGPSRAHTPRVLAALSRECTKATFFMVGRMAQAHPAVAQRVARAGHTIAHHTHSHANLAQRSPTAANTEIQRGIAAVNRALGSYRRRSTRLFRYPYLARSNTVDGILKRNGLIPISAGILSLDWRGGSGAAVVTRVMSQLSRKRRGVILLHDIQGRTASILPTLLQRLKQGGYRVVHLRSGGVRLKDTPVAALNPAPAKSSGSGRLEINITRPSCSGFFSCWRQRRVAKKARAEHLKRVAAARTARRGTDKTTTGSIRRPARKGFFARWRERALARRSERDRKLADRRIASVSFTRRSGERKTERKGFFALLRERRARRRASEGLDGQSARGTLLSSQRTREAFVPGR